MDDWLMTLADIEVIQDGLFQMDFLLVNLNTHKKKQYRCFVEPSDFFSKLGFAMQANHRDWVRSQEEVEKVESEEEV